MSIIQIDPPPGEVPPLFGDTVRMSEEWVKWFDTLRLALNAQDINEWLAGKAGHITVVDDGDRTATLEQAEVWDDFRFSGLSAKTPAANAPNWAQVSDDGAGSVGVFAYHFDDGEYFFITAQLPHSWKEGSTIYPHIHFMTTSDVDPSDNFGIGLECTWTEIDSDIGTTVNQERDVPTGVNSNGKHQLSNIPAGGISGVGHTISSVLLFRLYRKAAAVDNYAGQVVITDIDIHFEKDTLGSQTATAK